MPPEAKLARRREEALRLAREAGAAVERHGDRLGEKQRAELEEAVRGLEAAAGAEEGARIGRAEERLDRLLRRHLPSARRGALREYAEAVAVAVALALLLRTFVVEPFRIPSSSMAPTLLMGDQVLVNKLAYGPSIPFTERRLFAATPPRRGDVVVFESPREPGRDFVKRVVGLPGDVIEIRDQVLHVNGVPQPLSDQGPWGYEDFNESTGRWWRDSCRRQRERLAEGALGLAAGEDPAAAWRAAAVAGVRAHEVLLCRHARPGEREGPFVRVAPGHLFVLGDNRDRSADSRADGGWQVPLSKVKGRATLVWWSWGRGGLGPFGGSGLRTDRLFKRIE